jgi:hypothetical protein
MFFQWILKGIPFDDDSRAVAMLRYSGICCRWWERVGKISSPEVQEKLTQRNLDWHLNRYDQPDPLQGNDPFFEHTPYISTTAGTIERDWRLRRNWVQPAFLTALRFATRNATEPGYIFYGYVYTLGMPSVQLLPFAEEVRELHTYQDFLPYHHEGEIVAKVHIPSVNLHRIQKFAPASIEGDLAAGILPRPVLEVKNPFSARPEAFANIRGAI